MQFPFRQSTFLFNFLFPLRLLFCTFVWTVFAVFYPTSRPLITPKHKRGRDKPRWMEKSKNVENKERNLKYPPQNVEEKSKRNSKPKNKGHEVWGRSLHAPGVLCKSRQIGQCNCHLFWWSSFTFCMEKWSNTTTMCISFYCYVAVWTEHPTNTSWAIMEPWPDLAWPDIRSICTVLWIMVMGRTFGRWLDPPVFRRECDGVFFDSSLPVPFCLTGPSFCGFCGLCGSSRRERIL